MLVFKMSADPKDLEQKGACMGEKFSKAFRDNIIQALEELRLKRQLEVANTEKANQLLRENYELCRQKDESTCSFQKEIDRLNERLSESDRELKETKERLQGFEKKQKAVQQYENEGIKMLKDEIITLQLSKHNLEKKLKEQECQFNMKSSARESLLKQLKSLQDRVKAVEEQRDKTQGELINIESTVQKATLFQNRILRVNSHQGCTLERLKTELTATNQELIKARVMIDKLNCVTKSAEENISSDVSRRMKDPKYDIFKEKLEEHVEQLKSENERLLVELHKQTDLVNQLNNRVTAMSTSEMGLHFLVDDLRAENMRLKNKNETNSVADNETQTNEQALEMNKEKEEVKQEVETASKPEGFQNEGSNPEVNTEQEDTCQENPVHLPAEMEKKEGNQHDNE